MLTRRAIADYFACRHPIEPQRDGSRKKRHAIKIMGIRTRCCFKCFIGTYDLHPEVAGLDLFRPSYVRNLRRWLSIQKYGWCWESKWGGDINSCHDKDCSRCRDYGDTLLWTKYPDQVYENRYRLRMIDHHEKRHLLHHVLPGHLVSKYLVAIVAGYMGPEY